MLLLDSVGRFDVDELFFKVFEFLVLFMVYVEEILCEDKFLDYGYGYVYENVMMVDVVIEVSVDIGVVKDGIVEMVN